MGTTPESASEDRLVGAAELLETYGERHGLGNFRLAGEGQLIATVAEGRTLLDVARFELDAGAALGATVSVISAGAPLAADLDRGPLRGSCALCGVTRSIAATVTVRGVSVDVPMEECTTCGTRWLTEDTARWLDDHNR